MQISARLLKIVDFIDNLKKKSHCIDNKNPLMDSYLHKQIRF